MGARQPGAGGPAHGRASGARTIRRRAKEKGNAWIKVCEIALFPLTHLLGRRRFVGAQRIPQRGAALIVANHISHIDPIFDVVYVRETGRLPHVLAKASLWKIPLIGKVLTHTQQIPVERGNGAGQKALAAATDVLAEGGVVVIYPEGTVTKDPDMWPMRPRAGVAALALSGDFPVIPVAHWGSNHVYTSYGKGRRFKPLPRKDVHVVAGEPIDLSAWRGQPIDNRAIRDVSHLIMERIAQMVAELRDEEAPAALFNPKTANRRAAEAPGESDAAGHE
jgi:1-acyl-sn-glycerol-3-phosphate acyltransferase